VVRVRAGKPKDSEKLLRASYENAKKNLAEGG